MVGAAVSLEFRGQLEPACVLLYNNVCEQAEQMSGFAKGRRVQMFQDNKHSQLGTDVMILQGVLYRLMLSVTF